MKKLLLFLGITLSVLTSVRAQEAVTGDVTLEMADGTTKRGWCRTHMVNEVKFFEISNEPKGERVRYDNDQIARIVFDAGAVYVKKDIIYTAKGKKIHNVWVRLDYAGRGIALYSAYREGVERLHTMSKNVSHRTYYIALGDDPGVWTTTHYISGGVINQSGSNRALLNYYFGKRYKQYAGFTERIKAKEFNTKETPIEVVKAWEETYGTPVEQ